MLSSPSPPAPPVSVVIPTYNRADRLPRALESVLGQVAPSDEVIVVDDGSQDETADVVAGFGERVRYLHRANGGAGAARTTGIEAARHEWVAFLDSDDVWLPGKLRVQRAAIRRFPDAVLCFAEYEGRTRTGERHPTRMQAGGWRPDHLGPAREVTDGDLTFVAHLGDAFEMFFDTGPLLQINTVLARRDDLLACPFPTDVSIYEEDEVFARLARRGPVLYVDRVVSVLQAHAGPRLSDALGGPVAQGAWLAILERVWGEESSFLERRGADHRAKVEALRLKYVRSLLVRGERDSARRELRRMATPPPGLRLLSLVPAPVLDPVLRLRRTLRSALQRTGSG